VEGVITGSTPLTHDILEIHIQLDQTLPAYVAGQYAEISVEGIEQPRSYSFACAPFLEQAGHITFYVRHVPGGEMSSWLHDENRIGARVTVNGPHGTFYLRAGDAPILCIAGGSGLAPIKALLEQHAEDGFKRPATFLFGARTQRDLYGIEQMQRMADRYPQRFRFVPVLSDEAADNDWSGARGLVTDSVAAQNLDLPACQAYLCGPPPMIDSAIEVLTKAGLAQDRIFFDKFLDASHLPGGKR
jgi:CDP-4-dehydro-6-deoxyglucose reductase